LRGNFIPTQSPLTLLSLHLLAKIAAQSTFPRRHAQRKAIIRGRNETLPRDLSCQEPRLQGRKPRSRVKGYDSGYGSAGEDWREDQAKHYNEVIDQYEEEGPVMSNLSDSILEKVKKEEEMWQM
jgi:hypothetical protein